MRRSHPALIALLLAAPALAVERPFELIAADRLLRERRRRQQQRDECQMAPTHRALLFSGN